jgi:predicted nucleotidyltransferase component of viral defense system
MIDAAQHKNILIKILKDIFTDSSLNAVLGFKGGTAAFLFYNLSRLSVDLDFDLLNVKKDSEIFDTIKNILQQYGTIKEAQKKRYSLFFLLSYTTKQTGAHNIKVEINKRDFGSQYELKQYMGIPMRVMVQADMVAHKIVAMHERIGKANRDIFDVWFFLHNNWPINKKIVEQRTHMPYKEFIQKCINDLEKMNRKTILSGLGELLDEKQKAWVKSKLIDETIFLLKLSLENN